MPLPPTVWGGYSPLRRAYRRFRPAWMSRLTPSGRAAQAFLEGTGRRVVRGPFQGMEYPAGNLPRVNFAAAKILGSYECELHPALEQLVALRPAQVVDVGSADGYYAVGLAARAADGTPIVAFETDAGERRMAAEMATLNGVDERISFRGTCDPPTLAESLAENAALLCDCEGYERELLRPDAVPQLRSATILAELHPMFSPGIEEVVRARFESTHEVDVIRMRRRTREAWPELRDLDERSAFLVLSEGWTSESEWESPDFQRRWAFMTPRRAP